MKHLIIFFLAYSVTACMRGPAGENGKSITGSKGDTGAVGPTGPRGTDGLNGNDGRDGTDASPVVPVALCSDTPTYPSVFVEYAFCIDHNLYAVYSDRGGFATLLTPGAYRSNAIGSSCNFTVNANCEVVR
jgi:hypothetical protein